MSPPRARKKSTAYSGYDCFIYIIIFLFSVAGYVFYPGFARAQPDIVRDRENCLLCHGYPTMGRYDTTGKKRIFYVNGREYAASVHGRFRCTNCHVGLDKIPHSHIEKVDCSATCHINGFSSDGYFSHKDVVEKYEASVHGRGNDMNGPYHDDLPTCTYCHNNRIHNDPDGAWNRMIDTSDEAVLVYRHPLSRLRSQKQIIELCSSCHEDRAKMARHGLESIETYKDTFHWEQMKYGVPDSPDCISCHVPMGYSSHTLRSVDDPLSPVYKTNRIKTCANEGGIQTCHPDATADFASGRVHTYGIKAQLATGESSFTVDDRFTSLLVKKARTDIQDDEIFHYKVLKMIKLFYKILIGCTIGFMSLHQLLDYIRARKNHNASH